MNDHLLYQKSQTDMFLNPWVLPIPPLVFFLACHPVVRSTRPYLRNVDRCRMVGCYDLWIAKCTNRPKGSWGSLWCYPCLSFSFPHSLFVSFSLCLSISSYSLSLSLSPPPPLSFCRYLDYLSVCLVCRVWSCRTCHRQCILHIHFKCPTCGTAFETATKPSHFALSWQGARSLAPATQHDTSTSKGGRICGVLSGLT